MGQRLWAIAALVFPLFLALGNESANAQPRTLQCLDSERIIQNSTNTIICRTKVYEITDPPIRSLMLRRVDETLKIVVNVFIADAPDFRQVIAIEEPCKEPHLEACKKATFFLKDRQFDSWDVRNTTHPELAETYRTEVSQILGEFGLMPYRPITPVRY